MKTSESRKETALFRIFCKVWLFSHSKRAAHVDSLALGHSFTRSFTYSLVQPVLLAGREPGTQETRSCPQGVVSPGESDFRLLMGK